MAKAVIFDMNGVIVDDERIHQESWRRFCLNHGFQLTDEEFKQQVFGRRETDTIGDLFKREIPQGEMEQYLHERVTIAMNLFRPQLAPTPGVIDFIRSLNQEEIPMAVATSARKIYSDFILDGLNIRKFFDAIITAEDVRIGKPDPEIFLKAADSIGVNPELCIVIEDSLSGIKAAKAANMEVIGITTTHPDNELALADKIINNFGEISASTIEGMRRVTSSEGESRM